MSQFSAVENSTVTQVKRAMLGTILQQRYQVVQLLGVGGCCQTYIARDLSQPGDSLCVVKHLQPIDGNSIWMSKLRRLFVKEAEALEQLRGCSQVPQLFEYFEQDQQFYLVEELIDGHPLNVDIQPQRRWSQSQVVQMLQDVLGILEVVHSHGLIHRDLKPSNLIRRQQDGRLVLIDFGSVKQAWTQVFTIQQTTASSATNGVPATIAVGTPGYMPPEQLQGKPRPNSDLYGLGMMAIQALTGLSPTQLLDHPQTGELIWRDYADVSPQLAGVLQKMVYYHFKDRYQSATEVLQALQPLTDFSLPVQSKTLFTQHLLQREDAPQQLVTDEALSPTLDFQLDEIPVVLSQRLEALYDTYSAAAASPTCAHNSIWFIGLSIGIVSTLALLLGGYYILKITAPTSSATPVKANISALSVSGE